jgi:UDPglucose 6-dehydrogenase
MAKLMSHPVIIDGRNFLNPQDMEKAGFQYIGVGR